MRQMALFQDSSWKKDKIVNVASVPQRSPFRYPGGKTWLVPQVRQWLSTKGKRPVEFIEAFAGGAIIGLTVAFERLAEHVLLVELDQDVASVWQTILGGEGKWLAKRISSFELTQGNVEKLLSTTPRDLRERGFQTILRNRVCHGGILAPGAGLIKNGENGKGIKSRWYPETLNKRILNIVAIKNQVAFVQGDGMEIIREKRNCTDTVFFIDPPYTAGGKRAGTRLYTHFDLDHEELFKIVSKVKGDFLLTYDNSEEIRDMVRRHKFEVREIAMKGTHHTKMHELLISRDLSWL
jgi:DNA adenine methylase